MRSTWCFFTTAHLTSGSRPFGFRIFGLQGSPNLRVPPSTPPFQLCDPYPLLMASHESLPEPCSQSTMLPRACQELARRYSTRRVQLESYCGIRSPTTIPGMLPLYFFLAITTQSQSVMVLQTQIPECCYIWTFWGLRQPATTV